MRLTLAAAGVAGAAALLSACEATNHDLTVTTAADGTDAAPGDGVCEMTAGLGDCSLRAAVDESNASDAVELITIAPGVDPVLTLPAVGDLEDNIDGDLDLTDGATIEGNGATIDGGGHDRVLHFQTDSTSNPTWYTIRNVTITGGDVADGAGVFVGDLTNVTIERSTITGNSTPGLGGGLFVEVDGAAAVNFSTISGNAADSEAAAVYARGSTNLLHTTIADNTSPNAAIAHDNILASGDLRLTATIVEAPPAGVACTGTITSGGHTIATDTSCALTATGDQQNVDPRLGPLTDNGGPTRTHTINPGVSPARDTLPPGGLCSAPFPDQRGVTRPQGTGCDIGAVETEVLEPLTLGGPGATLGNDPVEGVFPGRWLFSSGTNSAKGQGDRFQTWNCGGSVLGCSGSVNAEYDADGYLFDARVPPDTTGDTVVQVFDPLFYDHVNSCNVAWLPTAPLPSWYGQTHASGGGGFAGQPVARFARGSVNQWCPGDSNGAATNRPDLTFVVRTPSPDPADPLAGEVVCAASYGSAQIIDGADTGTTANQEQDFRDLLRGTTSVSANNFNDYGPTVHIENGGTVPDTDLTFERAWRRWLDLCRIPAANVVPGDYVVQVRTNADPTDPTQALPPPGATGNQRYALRLGTDTGLNDLLGSSHLDQDGYGLVAPHHLAILVNEATTNNTSAPLVRVPSEHAGRNVRVELYDITDGGAILDLEVRPPIDSGLSVFSSCAIARVTDTSGRVPLITTFGGTSTSPPGLIVGEGCAMGAGSATGNGATFILDIAIPDDYVCNDADPAGCWLTIDILYGSSPQDNNTWTAGVWDPPWSTP